MKFVVAAIAAFAAIAAAAPTQQDLYLSSEKPASAAPAPAPAPAPTAGNRCAECVKYCGDGSNGIALGGACLIVKCGIQCIIA